MNREKNVTLRLVSTVKQERVRPPTTAAHVRTVQLTPPQQVVRPDEAPRASGFSRQWGRPAGDSGSVGELSRSGAETWRHVGRCPLVSRCRGSHYSTAQTLALTAVR